MHTIFSMTNVLRWCYDCLCLTDSWVLVAVAILGGVALYLYPSIFGQRERKKERRLTFEPSANSFSHLDTSEHSHGRARVSSWDAFSSLRSGSRPRSTSFDNFAFSPPSTAHIDEERQDGEWMVSPRNATRISMVPCKYHGPRVKLLRYETWTKPPQWIDKARQLLPTTVPTLQRILQIRVDNESVLSVHTPSGSTETDFTVQANLISVHPRAPATCGVLQVYVKDAPQSEWVEYTFTTARDAAQFQIDLQSLQAFGLQIVHMYQALEMVHRGSPAFLGTESVLHDRTVLSGDLDKDGTGIAWDDVMRCLGVQFPLMRLRLEQLWWSEMSGMEQSSDDNEITSVVGMKEEYQNKRLILGVIDFFRLFVPVLPEKSRPETNPSSQRFKRTLRWRKRVARASVLVQSYVNARVIVNKGWKLGLALPSGYWSKRMAYDETVDNVKRDSFTENEFYEPTVSRDFQCIVRGKDASTVHSKAQAFTLVDTHLFRSTESDAPGSFDFTSDPVESLPSLPSLLKRNKTSGFFILTLRIRRDLAVVYVFVRSLPKEIDPAFDEAWTSLCEADATTRSDRFECIFGLSAKESGMSISSRIMWQMLSTAIRYKGGEQHVSQKNAGSSDQYPLGSCALSQIGELRHFGGWNGAKADATPNYLALSVLVDAKTSWIRSLLADFVLRGKEILTFAIKIRAGDPSQLPERALAAVRHAGISSGMEPIEFTPSRVTMPAFMEQVNPVGWQGLMVGQLTEDAVSSITSIANGRRPLASIIATSDPIDKKINQVIEILEDVRVPTRASPAEVARGDFSHTTILRCPPSAQAALGGRADLKQVAVLEIVSRDDIRRCLISCGMNVKATACSVVDTAAWRGLTFPIDTRACRVELQNGQFFQQGRDLSGHPVFYFRAMCRGPWRGDEDAVISAVLHRLETSLNRFVLSNTNIRCTFIVLLGKPAEGDISATQKDDNSRISSSEPWHIHVNARLLHRLIDTLVLHYPERLHRALIVTKNSSKVLSNRTSYFGRHLKGFKDRVRILRSYETLANFVHTSELVQLAGGIAPVEKSAFDPV